MDEDGHSADEFYEEVVYKNAKVKKRRLIKLVSNLKPEVCSSILNIKLLIPHI